VFDRHRAAEGMESFRNDRIDSAMGLHGQIVFLDNANDTIVKSFDRTGKILKGLLKDYNTANGVDRFNGEGVGTLLGSWQAVPRRGCRRPVGACGGAPAPPYIKPMGPFKL
jgi:hypothetical protein